MNIKEEYADIIYLTLNRLPENYHEINFDMYLQRKLNDTGLFISNLDTKKVYYKLKQLYGNDNDCFKDNGELVEADLRQLKYYQKGVGIDGPKNTKRDEPVFILKIDSQNILYNGYHRTLCFMEENTWIVKAYKLELSF